MEMNTLLSPLCYKQQIWNYVLHGDRKDGLAGKPLATHTYKLEFEFPSTHIKCRAQCLLPYSCSREVKTGGLLGLACQPMSSVLITQLSVQWKTSLPKMKSDWERCPVSTCDHCVCKHMYSCTCIYKGASDKHTHTQNNKFISYK